jgi:hypothetical protein
MTGLFCADFNLQKNSGLVLAHPVSLESILGDLVFFAVGAGLGIQLDGSNRLAFEQRRGAVLPDFFAGGGVFGLRETSGFAGDEDRGARVRRVISMAQDGDRAAAKTTKAVSSFMVMKRGVWM